MATIALAAAAAAVLAGCNAEVHVGTDGPTRASSDAAVPKVSAAQTAALVSQKLAAVANEPAPKVTCPDDLPGRVGATLRCTLGGDDGSTLGVTVTVTSVSGTNVDFAIKADDRATPAGEETPVAALHGPAPGPDPGPVPGPGLFGAVRRS